MPRFEIKGVDSRGEFVSKDVSARDAEEAVAKVKMTGFFPFGVSGADAVKEPSSEAKRGMGVRRLNLWSFFAYFQGITKKDIVQFTRNLRIYIQAGIPIYQALDILQKQTKKRRLVKIIETLANNVAGGKGFSESLAKYPRYFNSLYINLIHAGEISGNLINVLTRLENYLDTTLKRKSKFISASIYPCIVVVMTIGIISLINIVVIPKFEKAYKVLKIEMPKITTTVLSTSTWLSSHWFIIILCPVLIFVTIKLIRRNKIGRYITSYILLITPLIGHIICKSNLSLFYRTLSTLLYSGITILDTLKTSGSVIMNIVINKEIELITRGVYEGKEMHDMMKRSRLFDAFATYMVEAGETSGMLGEMLEKISDVYDEDLDVLYKRLESALEPVIIIILASIVGTIIIALYMPMVKLTQTLGRMR